MPTKLYIGSEQADFNEAFNVVFSIGDIRNLGFGNLNRSYTLNLPLTKTNKRLLKYISQPDVKSEPSSKGWLYIGELLVICGTIKVLNTYEYSAKIIIESDDWIDALKDKKLSALDLSTSTHDLTHANVENSWTASYPVYRYPMINFGGLMSGESGASAKWQPCDFIPMISIASLVNKILEPHTVTSAWVATTYIKDLFILGREKIANTDFIQNKALEVAVAADTDNQDVTSIPASTSGNSLINYVKVILSVETTDEGSDWGNDTYTVPEDGTYKFSVALKLANDAPTIPDFTITNEEVTIRIVSVRGASTTVLAETSAAAYTGTELIENITYSLATDHYHLEAGDEVSVLLYLSCTVTNGGAGPLDLTIGVKASGSTFENVWSNANRYPGINKSIVLSDYLPDMTQLDFLAAVRDLANVRFFKDRGRNNIYAEPWDQFLNVMASDITELVDHSSIDTELLAQSYNEKINFKWTDDTSDKMFEEYLKLNTAGPGNKELTLTSLMTKPGTLDIQHPFSTILTGAFELLTAYTVQIPKIWEEVPEFPFLTYNRKVGFNTRLVHWDGMTAGLTWYYQTETKTTYPKISAVSWDTLYTSYLMKFYHYIDKGKLFTVKMDITKGVLEPIDESLGVPVGTPAGRAQIMTMPSFITQFFTVVNTAANEGFRPTYKITINGIDNYFFLQRITTDGEVAELELILKQ